MIKSKINIYILIDIQDKIKDIPIYSTVFNLTSSAYHLKLIIKALIGCRAVLGVVSRTVLQAIGWLQLLLVVGGALL